jgi:hypothetical protein
MARPGRHIKGLQDPLVKRRRQGADHGRRRTVIDRPRCNAGQASSNEGRVSLPDVSLSTATASNRLYARSRSSLTTTTSYAPSLAYAISALDAARREATASGVSVPRPDSRSLSAWMEGGERKT